MSNSILDAMRADERGVAAASHLVNIVPFWGFILLLAIWLYFKERSRKVVFHVRQALVLQIGLLCFGVFALFFSILFRVVAVIHKDMGMFLSQANVLLAAAVYTVYALVCVWAAVTTLRGRSLMRIDRVCSGRL